HDGRVDMELHPQRSAEFRLALRIPGWCEGATVTAGGDVVPARSGAYHEIRRRWEPGDKVVLDMPMKPVVLVSRPEVEANRGQVAFRRGPLVYCLEKADAAGLDLARVAVVLDDENP